MIIFAKKNFSSAFCYKIKQKMQKRKKIDKISTNGLLGEVKNSLQSLE